jgi:SAM-dependent methyltransferase
MVRLAPPGTLCQNQALLEIVARSGARTFCEIGPGDGELSAALCRRGMQGVGIEVSAAAAAIARSALRDQIQAGMFRLVEGDFMAMADPPSGFDLAVSFMVMEHVQDDATFAARIVNVVRPGGMVIVGVPGRMDRWGIEDGTAGHFRRYEKAGLQQLLMNAGLEAVDVRSVSVPVANLSFHVGNFLIRRAGEERKLQLSQQQRTESSGIRDIPFKTVFPAPFKLILNPVAMYPFFVLQRMFYGTSLGLTLVGSGRRPNQTA